jgi:hypothetical protein
MNYFSRLATQIPFPALNRCIEGQISRPPARSGFGAEQLPQLTADDGSKVQPLQVSCVVLGDSLAPVDPTWEEQ